jgi:hypothetical protein
LAHHLHPWPERRGALPLEAATPHHQQVLRRGAPCHLLGQPALADPRLPGHQHQPPPPGRRPGQDRVQFRQLLLPPHQLAVAWRGQRRDGRRQFGRLRRQLARLTGGRRPVQRWPLPQDVGLQLTQPRARIDPQLLAQYATRSLERPQCLGLSAGAVQRQHQLSPQALPEWVAADQIAQLGGSHGMPAKGQLGGQAVLQHR